MSLGQFGSGLVSFLPSLWASPCWTFEDCAVPVGPAGVPG